MRLKIKNWSLYQHYKDRNPPWIKLHFSLLSSKDWVMMSNESRVLAIACMLIASRSNDLPGEFDADPMYFKRVAYLSKEPDFNPLIECGFLEYASGCKQVLAEFRPETEERQRQRREYNGQKYFPDFWSIYPKKVKKKDSLKKWRSKHLDKIAHIIIQDIRTRLTEDKRWKDGYIPDPTTYLNGERWEDEITQQKKKSMTYDEEQRYIRTMMADLKKELEEDGHVYGAH